MSSLLAAAAEVNVQSDFSPLLLRLFRAAPGLGEFFRVPADRRCLPLWKKKKKSSAAAVPSSLLASTGGKNDTAAEWKRYGCSQTMRCSADKDQNFSSTSPRLIYRTWEEEKLKEHVQQMHEAFRINVLKVGQQGPSGFCSDWSSVLRPHRWTYWAPVKGLIAPSEHPPGVLCGRWRFDWKQVADGQTGHPETAGPRRHQQTGSLNTSSLIYLNALSNTVTIDLVLLHFVKCEMKLT